MRVDFGPLLESKRRFLMKTIWKRSVMRWPQLGQIVSGHSHCESTKIKSPAQLLLL